MSVVSIVYSTGDPAGTGMARELMRIGTSRLEGVSLRGFPESVLEFEFLDERVPGEQYIVLSKHRSSSGRPSLTVHHTGNPTRRAEAGGEPLTLSIAHARLAGHILRLTKREVEENGGLGDIDVTYEATHHGPTRVARPLVFVEIGSTPRQWEDPVLHRLMARVIHEAVEDLISGRLPPCTTAAGFGGSHYPERFTRMALEAKACFGHIIPKYAIREGIDESVVRQAILRNSEPVKKVFMEKKAGPAPARRVIEKASLDLGVEFVKI